MRATRVALNCTTFELRSFMFKLLFIANATRSRSTLRRNMVEYQMVRGVKPRRENLEYSRKFKPLFTPRKEHLSLLREFSRLYVKFRASVQILFKRGFKKPILESCAKQLAELANFTKCNKMKVTAQTGRYRRLPSRAEFFSAQPTNEIMPSPAATPTRCGCCLC